MKENTPATLPSIAADLAAGRVTSRQLVEACLERISEPDGEGKRVFLSVNASTARATADYIDTMRNNGISPSQYAGIPVSVKDLFDVSGEVTTAGSIALRGTTPAT